jgi:prepilin-type N-terminal cleavage/methylation domain-containing protein
MKVSQKLKQGFTIVEMLVVIAVIAILAGIVTTVASNSVKNARDRRKDAMRSVLQSGLNVYYARNNTWPKALENVTDKTPPNDESIVTISGENADSVFQELIKESFLEKGAPYLDPNGLFVASTTGANSLRSKDGRYVKGVYGQDFSQAIKKTGKGVRHLEINQMAFGYPDKRSGFFVRYKIKYNILTDSASVSD